MNQKTIIYIGGFEFPDKNAAAHRVLGNAKIFRKLGYKVIFLGVDKELRYGSGVVKTKKHVEGFECWSIPYPTSVRQWLNYLTSVDAFIQVASMYENIEAVVCYNYQSGAFIKIKKYCKQRGIKVVADCTEWYDAKGNNVVFYVIKSLDSFLRMNIIQPKLDGLMVISKYLERHYKHVKNIVCIPPLVDKEDIKWKLVTVQSDRQKTTLLYAGSPGAGKDKLNRVIELLSKIKDKSFTFQIMGITKEQYLRSFPHHDNLLANLIDEIIFLGRINHYEALQYVKGADFTFFLRDITRMTMAGFPTKFVESINCGTPVITNQTSDLHDYLIEDVNGYWINIDDDEQAIQKLEDIFEKPKEKIREIKEQCRNHISFDYRMHMTTVKGFLERI